MSVLFVTSESFGAHDTGPGHPERPARLQAVLAGVRAAGLGDALVHVAPECAARADLERVHPALHIDALEQLCNAGGGEIDPDTVVCASSWTAALEAAGAGPTAVARLDAGEADAAFLAVRPPGHHARPRQAMGFCLLNNVAVTAAMLADRGERVLIVDWDAHHGNGTQDAFYGDGRVAYVSLHQWPLFPFTGRLTETGVGAGTGLTLNMPVPPTTTGDTFLAAVDEVVVPLAERFQPTWLLLSAGFDGHRMDPLARLNLTAGDYALLTERLTALVPPGRRLVFLEGGYDLEGLRDSSGACLAALAGARWVAPGEAPSSGGPGREVVQAAAALAGER